MSFLPLLLAMTIAEALGVTNSNIKAWDNAPLGIKASASWNGAGIRVKFETDLEPPYYVGVFTALDASYPTPYGRSITYRVSYDKSVQIAFLPADKYTTFVRVLTLEEAKKRNLLNEMPASEVLSYLSRIQLFTGSETPKDVWGPADVLDSPMELVSDYTWVGYLDVKDATGYAIRAKPYEMRDYYTVDEYVNEVDQYTSTFLTNTISGGARYDEATWVTKEKVYTMPSMEPKNVGEMIPPRKPSTQEWVDEPNGVIMVTTAFNAYSGRYTVRPKLVGTNVTGEASFAEIPAMDTSRGSGYRLVMCEDSGEMTIQRAYSLHTNISNVAVLPRHAKGLSTWNKLRIATDWLGNIFFKSSDAEHGRIELEGR